MRFGWMLSFALWAVVVGVTENVVRADDTIIGKFRNTYYYVVAESDYAQAPIDNAIVDIKGGVLARVSTAFKKAVDIEGTGKLIDGRVINFAARVNGEIRYRIVASDWGLGVGTCPLIPFHTIAVDPAFIPLGSLVQIDETVGMELPDGTRHNGLWRAEDVGGAIKRDRIDLFVGTPHEGGTVLSHGNITHLKALTVRLIAPPSSDSCIDRLPPE